MNSAYDVIIRPIVSERSFDLIEQGKYTFEVAKSAPKEEIASAVEKLFGVHVVKVNTLNVSGKKKRVRYQTPGTTRSRSRSSATSRPLSSAFARAPLGARAACRAGWIRAVPW